MSEKQWDVDEWGNIVEFQDVVEAHLVKLPKCDFCEGEACWDSKTTLGMWGYTCQECQDRIGLPALGLTAGLGKGQRLVKING